MKISRTTGRAARTARLIAAAVAIGSVTLAACGAQIRGEEEQNGSAQGNGREGKQGPLRIAVVPKAVGFDFWEQVRAGAECAATEHEDVTVQWDGVAQETDVTGQVDLLGDFVTSGVDGLVFAATDAQALSDVSDRALGEGIAVVNIDSGTDPQPEQVPVFATDNEAAAEEAAGLLADALGGGQHDIALISFQPGTATNDQRMAGFRAGLEDHPNLREVAAQSSESDYNTGLRVTEDILTANPGVDGIFAANEPGALGAAEAVRGAGKQGEIEIIAWDAAPEELKAVRDGTISALVVQNPFRMGYEGVQGAVKSLRTGEPPSSVDTGVTFVTKDNIDSERVQAVLEPSCENPPTAD